MDPLHFEFLVDKYREMFVDFGGDKKKYCFILKAENILTAISIAVKLQFTFNSPWTPYVPTLQNLLKTLSTQAHNVPKIKKIKKLKEEKKNQLSHCIFKALHSYYLFNLSSYFIFSFYRLKMRFLVNSFRSNWIGIPHLQNFYVKINSSSFRL